MSEKTLFVGIDVAKKRLDVAVSPSGETKTFSHDHPGLSALTSYVRSLAPALIVLEATGGYHKTVLSTLAAEGLPAVAVTRAREGLYIPYSEETAMIETVMRSRQRNDCAHFMQEKGLQFS